MMYKKSSPTGGSQDTIGSFKTPKQSTSRSRTVGQERPVPISSHEASSDSRSDIGITLSSSGARTIYGDPTSNSMHHADISADFIDSSRRSLHQNISSGSYKVNRSQGSENAVDDIQIDRRSAAPGTMFARLELSPTVDKSSRQTEYIARWPDSERTSGSATAEPNLVRHDIGLPEYTAMSSSLHDLSLTDADKLQRYELAAASRIDRPDNSTRSDLHLHSTGFQSSRPYQRNYHSTPTQVPISNQDRFIQSHSNYIDSLDLTGWIQQHQQQLIQQQMITSQNASFNHTTTDGSESSRVDIVRKVADDIIKEKDGIIDKQKVKILDLETRLSMASRDSSLSTVDAKHDKLLQDLQYENMTLKARLASQSGYRGNLQSSAVELEKQLCAAEYELNELKKSTNARLKSKDDAIASLNDQINQKDASLSDLERKLKQQGMTTDAIKKELERNLRYLNDLPTTEQHLANISNIKSLQETKTNLENINGQLEKRLVEATKGLSSRDALVESLEKSNQEFKTKADELQKQNQDLIDRLTSNVDLQQLEQLKVSNSRLQRDLEQIKKVYETKLRQHQQKLAMNQNEISQLKEQIELETSAVTALKEEITGKEQSIKKCRLAAKELADENQSLTEAKSKLEDELKVLTLSKSAEELRLQQQLMTELTVCLHDLQSLVKICCERAQGQDPNISALIGVSTFTTPPDEQSSKTSSAESMDVLKHRLKKARDLRHEVDRLREIVSDRFAEDLGRRLTCNPQ